MKERILFAPGANPTELLRSMAAHGADTFALRVTDGVGLARIALMRSGIIADHTFLTRSDETAVIHRLNCSGDAGLTASADIAGALHSLRLLIPENEAEIISSSLSEGIFREKNVRLAEHYRRYMEFCSCPPGESTPYMDGIDLMRLAMEEASAMDSEFITLKEFPLSPLEQAMLDVLAGGRQQNISLAELFEKQPAAADIDGITSAYGRSNEVEDILGQIYENRMPLDTCTVAVSNTAAYSQLFYDYALRFDLPVTFGCGVPISNSNPAKLLQLYIEWATYGYLGIDALRRTIMSDCFDRNALLRRLNDVCPDFFRWNHLIEVTGSLRLGLPGGDDEDRRRIEAYRPYLHSASDESRHAHNEQDLDCAAVLAAELRRGAAYFVCRYSRVRHDHPLTKRVDISARQTIERILDARFYPDGLSMDEITAAVAGQSVCREGSAEGHLHITGITGALCCQRFNLFVAGLDADDFPGKPTENYLLLDKDYELICKSGDSPTSYQRVNRKKQSLIDLVGLAGALGVSVRLSFPSIELASHSGLNPSAVLYELYALTKTGSGTDDFERSIRHAGFFEHIVSPSSVIGAEYIRGNIAAGKLSAAADDDGENSTDGTAVSLDRTFSPTAVEKYIQCPRKFYLNNILRLKDPETDDPAQIISGMQTGTLIHQLMEEFTGAKPSREQFMTRAEQLFDMHLASRPPMNEADADAERREFIYIANSAYDDDPWNEILLAEADLETQLPNGIRLAGRVDRVEKLPDGSAIIADYKSARSITHAENDVKSCIQALLYARMMEDNGQPVSGCEFRYLRYGRTVECRYDEDAKLQLKQYLDDFAEALQTGSFPANNENCKYCPVYSICGKGEQ